MISRGKMLGDEARTRVRVVRDGLRDLLQMLSADGSRDLVLTPAPDKRRGEVEAAGELIAAKAPGRRLVTVSGCSAAWLARLLGVQEVPGSNPGIPTMF